MKQPPKDYADKSWMDEDAPEEWEYENKEAMMDIAKFFTILLAVVMIALGIYLLTAGR